MTSLAWVCAASFGAPVVPPVWKSAARSVEPRAAHRRSASGRLLGRQRGAGSRPARRRSAGSAGRAPGRAGRAAARGAASSTGLAGERPRGLPHLPGRARDRRRRAPARRTGAAARRGAARDRPPLIGAAMPASCAARVAVISSSQFGRQQRDRVGAAHARARAARWRSGARRPSSSAKVRSHRLAASARPSGRTRHGDAVRPQRRRPGRAARRSCSGRPRSASGTASIAARSSGASYVGQSRARSSGAPHDGALACRGRSRRRRCRRRPRRRRRA